MRETRDVKQVFGRMKSGSKRISEPSGNGVFGNIRIFFCRGRRQCLKSSTRKKGRDTVIKVIGIGGAGGNAVDHMIREG